MAEKLSDSATTAWSRLVRASQSVTAAIEAELKQAGLPPLDWYDVLLELERAPARELRPREIAREMLFTRYNVSRLVDRLEQRGLVAREPCPDDARGAVVRITAQGRALRGQMWPVYAAAIRTHFATKLSEKDARQLSTLLGKLLQGEPP